MDSPEELRPGDEGFGGFQMQPPENCVEYMLFIIDHQANGGAAATARLPTLEAVRKAAVKKADELTSDYIWQREPFKLETKVENGLAYLHGTTDYGDNVEDEWLIVYLLRELSKTFPNLWIRVFDSDGEFLLIEAAKVLPKWLSPEMDSNRVWIHDGKLRIIPVINTTTTTGSSSATANSKSISLPEALKVIRSTPNLPIHSAFIEAESFYRLDKYPGQITDSLHHSLIAIPRKLAYIIHARPKAIAPATEAFYLRDPAAMKPILSTSTSTSAALLFPPTDLITISVRFTKVLYAQLKSQRFDPPPPAWKAVLQAAEAAAALAAADADADDALQKLSPIEMGMKVTTGFEMLARAAHSSASRVAREVALLLDDLEEDGGDAALPSDEDIKRWKDVGRNDDDSWMDINYADFERELDGRGRGGKTGGGGDGDKAFGDAQTQADLQKMVSRFEAFLNDEDAGLDGAEVDEMDEDDDEEDTDEEGDSEDEDREVSFDEEQFARMMREMMGLPPSEDNDKLAAQKGGGKQKAAAGAGAASSSGNVGKSLGSDSDSDSDDDDTNAEEEEKEIRNLMMQMEAELKGHGALALDPSAVKKKKAAQPLLNAKSGKGEGSSSTGKGKEVATELPGEEEEDDDDDDEVDIDYNLAKNLLESFKSQAGMAGPAGNLLSLMGMSLPRDEGDDDEDEDDKVKG
ncbi:SGT1 protein-domain-containing protein [Bombardia bombarda]|uniref:SGT1 protein-domain-containing protein n=1 Tax=Bombardia bombarda TaxID=252184 RepID=A0AA39WBR6_9PEZI|nr:SGT1 protein-domain-containing protein [Bombardia bombarda]